MLVFTFITLSLLSASYAAVPEKCTVLECFNVLEQLVSFQDAKVACEAAGKGALADMHGSYRLNRILGKHFKKSNVTTGLWIDVTSDDSPTFFVDDQPTEDIDSNGVSMDPSQSFQWVVAPEDGQYYTLCASEKTSGSD
ncbi:hypothetical protein RRG08_028446 [Elysia crispata]|uniref:C-type lectin domain-containing protein n=1 Tax=Elysia crispata TaxID=231223 RepID=A0AAE1E4S5_9GAST|nr:hypothetical protein RRG08_028446 [Elysia crispata]